MWVVGVPACRDMLSVHVQVDKPAIRGERYLAAIHVKTFEFFRRQVVRRPLVECESGSVL